MITKGFVYIQKNKRKKKAKVIINKTKGKALLRDLNYAFF